ncbi:nuclease domain-containing protein [Clostridium perfringens]|uniref:nuclease domain-containing protein n=1 Tax=Clostridium perfringens TaxID=1502 RepID=UPI0024BC49A6|nr:nuclease domain-containing protein [Clostridium perfringens]
MNLEYALIDLNNNKDILEIINIFNKTKEGYFYFNQYQRGRRGHILKFAIKVLDNLDKTSIRVYLNDNKNTEFKYENKTNYFYIDGEVGIEKAGFFYLTIADLNGKCLYKSDKILVKPSIISIEQYDQMVDMLLNINMLLVNQNDSETYLYKEGKYIDLSEYILHLVNEIEFNLSNIEKSPGRRLIKEDKKVSYNKIKKFNSKILLEKDMYPFKDKFLAPVTKETFNIYENRLIYNFLLDLKKFIELNQYEVKSLLIKEEREKVEINKILLKYNTIDYKKRLEIRKEKNDKKIKKLENQLINLRFCNLRVKEYLDTTIFKELKVVNLMREEVKITQLFIHDIFYNKMYKLIQEFYDFSGKEFNIDAEELKIKNLYEIFEVWAYFYMVKVMVREQGWIIPKKSNIVYNANKYIKENGNLHGFIINLEHKLTNHNKVSLKIIYNKTLNLENKKLRPDYTFEFDIDGNKKIFYLDAKYHNYLDDSNESLNKDLNNTAFNKYYNELIKTEYKATGSYILHCVDNLKYRYFGGNKGNTHRIGGFSMLPDKHNDFKVWISLIMEWFYDEYRVCWECGSLETNVESMETRGKNEKKHITCKNCGSFWVKTKCESCSCKKLIKHDLESKQYHKKTNEKWMVHCPECGSCGNVKQVKERTYYYS